MRNRHHTFTYANAVDQAIRLAPSPLVARGILDGAMSVYLERFLNVPKQPAPRPTGSRRTAADLLATFDRHGRFDEAAEIVADLLAANNHEQVVRTLGRALLREDAGFHQFQVYEAGLRLSEHLAPSRLGDDLLVGVTRFLAAHSPTVRATGQTFNTAEHLHRGEALHEAL